MKTQAPPLKASPLQIDRHEFLDVEMHANEGNDCHTSLPLTVNRSFAHHKDDPLQWRVELTIRFGGKEEGKDSVYSGSLRIAGYFRVSPKYPADKVTQLIEVTAASILYGACREMLANLTARGSHGVVSLPSVSFVAPRKQKALPAPAADTRDKSVSQTPTRRRRRKLEM